MHLSQFLFISLFLLDYNVNMAKNSSFRGKLASPCVCARPTCTKRISGVFNVVAPDYVEFRGITASNERLILKGLEIGFQSNVND